jgi:hypothetical protein
LSPRKPGVQLGFFVFLAHEKPKQLSLTPHPDTHLFPNAHPNRLSNLVGCPKHIHEGFVTPEWARWKNSLGAREPSAAEIMKKALEIDEMFIGNWVFPV